MESRVGQQLGKYRLVRLLGQGSFAEVYLGEHMHLKTAAAVKVLTTLLTDFSVPNIVGDLIGAGGGTPALLRVANIALVITVLYFLRRKGDWLSGAGWSTLALVLSLAWLVPWYVIWVLPLAALGTSVPLRRAAVAFTAYLVFAFIPETGFFLADHGINPMGGSAGQASKQLQQKLAG